jgi:hypothetical protein
MRGFTSLRALAAAVLAPAAWACDCPPTSTSVDAGQSVGGLVPSSVVAPWLGDHPGQLTWVLNGNTTAVHFDVEQQGAITETTLPCGAFSDNTPDFSANLTARMTTDDGTMDVTSADTMSFGPDGHVVRDLSFILSPSFTQAQAAKTGTGATNMDLEFTVTDHDGKPQGTTAAEWLGGDSQLTIARIVFGP